MGKFVMSVRQAAELDLALERNNLTAADVKMLSQGFALSRVRDMFRGQAPNKEKPLSFVSDITVPAIYRFVASEVFVTGVNKDGIRIGFLGDNFKAQFGKVVEKNIPKNELEINSLGRSADAIEIAGALAREKRVVWVSQIYRIVQDQANGQVDGLLLVNDRANLFLAYGVDGNLWFVEVRWFSDSWDFSAFPLNCPNIWYVDDQVFSYK